MSHPSSISALLRPIPAGHIHLRDDRLAQSWTVNIQPFQLTCYPITQAIFETVMGHNPSSYPAADQPVETVSWVEAIGFCNALSKAEGLKPCYLMAGPEGPVDFDPLATGYRLPTEAEWQYACQTGEAAIRYGALDEIAWYKANSAGRPQPVGHKTPNAWGLYDMLGNVWEWCHDLYDETVYGSYRVFRGGGWYDEARSVMATNRRRSHPLAFRIDDLGFRVARGQAI